MANAEQDISDGGGGDEALCLEWLCKQVVGSLLVKENVWDKLLLDEAKL